MEGFDVSSGFVNDVANGIKSARDLIQTLIDSAQRAARVFRERAAQFWKTILERQKAEALFASLLGVDHHAMRTRTLYLLGRIACIRLPLFRYGPQLSGFRHRFR